jgi:hypothetical protein
MASQEVYRGFLQYNVDMHKIGLEGKGKKTDIALLRLLSGYTTPLTISKMTELDGLSQNYHERKARAGIYRRAIYGRRDFTCCRPIAEGMCGNL